MPKGLTQTQVIAQRRNTDIELFRELEGKVVEYLIADRGDELTAIVGRVGENHVEMKYIMGMYQSISSRKVYHRNYIMEVSEPQNESKKNTAQHITWFNSQVV